jgi:hypothetical protein
MLDPKGFSNVEVRLHHADGDTEINVAVDNGQFDLGAIEVTPDVMIEASLRTDSGAAVGYGRAAALVDLRDKERIVIPVRRPIVYLAGFISIDQDNDATTTNDIVSTKSPPTFYDLAANTLLDGTTKLMENSVLMVAAGPRLFTFDQTPMNGMLTGVPTMKEVSTGDHAIVGSVGAMIDGAVVDAAGTDDGTLVLLATTTHLYVIDVNNQTARPIADGSFARVAIVSSGDRALSAVAIRNRSTTGACTAELVWTSVNADDTNTTMTIGTSGYTDVAGDNNRGFYVDNCKGGELGEATATSTQVLRSSLGKPAALAVARGQAWIGIERMAGMSLVSVNLVGTDPPRTLLDEDTSLVVEVDDEPGVQRRLDAKSVTFKHLEIGAGGDYIAATVTATYEGARVFDAFPRMEWESEDLRVLDTSTGATVQNYRSWCDGVMYIQDPIFDIYPWHCAKAAGQSAPDDIDLEHRINSMTFQFGKK